MSTAATDNHAHAEGDEHGHNPYLAHHFDTPEQQFSTGKLGMWTFLATEVLMFGGLFCAYAVYRYNHPEVYLFAHNALDSTMGMINTIVLLASSFTMAWGVRAAQLNQRKLLLLMLALTFMGGVVFMCVKAVEYEAKWKHHLFPGKFNALNAEYAQGKDAAEASEAKAGTIEYIEEHIATHGGSAPEEFVDPAEKAVVPIQTLATDGHAGTPDAALIEPPAYVAAGINAEADNAAAHHSVYYNTMKAPDKATVNAFFSIYFMMTGLHGIHVLVGMGILAWLFIRAFRNEFNSHYFTPVDLGGLYWHLVDLIWIFLFPLLYLIH